MRRAIGVIFLLLTGCSELSDVNRAMTLSCKHMQLLAEYNSLPVMVQDQLDLRVEMTQTAYDALVRGNSADEESAIVIDQSMLNPCEY